MGKKRPAESSSKTPVPEKKAKLVSPGGSQKTGRYLSPWFLFDIGNLFCPLCQFSQRVPKHADIHFGIHQVS